MLKNELKILLAQDETREVLETLLSESKKASDHESNQQLILLSARLEKLEKSQLIGTLSTAEFNVESAKINQGLLALVDKMPFQPSTIKVKSNTKENDSKEGYQWKYILIIIGIIGMLGLAEVLNFIDIIPSSSNETAELTIYVHGSGGIQDYVLENEGKLIVDFLGNRVDAQVGENGRTVFSETPSKFMGTLLPISIQADGYESAHPDKQYKWEGKPIYYEVQKDSKSRQIKGIVKSEDGSVGLANVQVMIQNEFLIMTDDLGRFTHTMEENQVQEKYDLSFQKEGYQPKSEYYYPGSTAEFRLKQKSL
ncbi:MAG: hypothetical protein NXI23_02915 [Bacteroidetes bacterium]|jgi:hypothetical protein|nr:hypothetical protein [Bacteroidota bacterium]